MNNADDHVGGVGVGGGCGCGGVGDGGIIIIIQERVRFVTTSLP